MTLTASQILLYASAMLGLWAVPGPVWVALVARALSGGMRGSVPLAVGVALGDLLWPLCAIFGMAWVLSTYGEALAVLRWLAAAVFLWMGIHLLRAPATALQASSRLTKPGIWAGLVVGMAAVIGNPKAIVFYMGVLPGFFDLAALTGWDVVVIISISAFVPLTGNVLLALGLDRARALLQSPKALRWMNIGAGGLLILVGLVIPFT